MHGFSLPNHALAEAVFHAQQFVLFALEHLVDGHAGPSRHDLSDVVGRHGLLHHLAVVFLGFDIGELLLKLGNPAIGQFARALVFATALGVGELDAQAIQLALDLLRVRQLVLLGTPARGQVRRTLFEIG